METEYALYMLLVGAIVVLVLLLRSGLQRIGVPPLVGYFVLGFLLRLVDVRWALLGEPGHQVFEFLAYLGIVILLFRVGLESDLPGLIRRLPSATVIWVGNVAVSGGLDFWAASQWLGWALIPSLFVAIALTATSVGISVVLWEDAELLNSDDGELMLDVAEMDDISGVVLMGVLFSLAPVLHATPAAPLVPLAAKTLGWFMLKLVAFAAGCVLFSRYVEEYITTFFERIQSWQGTMIVVLGIGMVVAAIAALLGFSLAIGAFFAGIIFSRDPDLVRVDPSFESMHHLFVSFFFIGIGLRIDPTALGVAVGPVLVLLLVAVAGKMLGTVPLALLFTGGSGALLIGLSMVPRAEITLIIMQRGLELGSWAVTPEMFADMVMVAALTALLVPPLARPLLTHRSPKTEMA